MKICRGTEKFFPETHLLCILLPPSLPKMSLISVWCLAVWFYAHCLRHNARLAFKFFHFLLLNSRYYAG